jgi:hypothetical protein
LGQEKELPGADDGRIMVDFPFSSSNRNNAPDKH